MTSRLLSALVICGLTAGLALGQSAPSSPALSWGPGTVGGAPMSGDPAAGGVPLPQSPSYAAPGVAPAQYAAPSGPAESVAPPGSSPGYAVPPQPTAEPIGAAPSYPAPSPMYAQPAVQPGYPAPQPAYPPPSYPQPLYQQPPPGAILAPPSPNFLNAPPPQPYYVPQVVAPVDAPHWVVTAEAMWLERTDDRSIFLGDAVTTAASGSPGFVLDELRSDDALFNWATGVKLQLAYCLSNHDAIEMTYYGLQHWSAGRSIYGDPVNETVFLYSPYTQTDTLIGGFDTRLGYTYQSTLNNLEITDRFAASGGLAWQVAGLWGIRYVQVSDKFTLTGEDTFTGDFENIDIKTSNNLLGPQIGLQIIRDWGRFQLNTELKAGIFANFNRETYSNLNSSGASGNPPGFVTVNDSKQSTAVAGLVEFILIAKYKLTDHLWLRGGYETAWIGGLATGPKQLAGFDHGSSIGLDGPSLGFEVNW